MRRTVAMASSVITQKQLHAMAHPLVVPMATLRPLVKLLIAQGISLSTLLRHTQLDAHVFVDQSQNISMADYLQIILNGREASLATDYALKLGEQFFINYDGALAQRIMCSTNAAEAMNLLVHYQTLFTQVLNLDFYIEDGVGYFSVQPRIPLGAAEDHFVEYAFAALYCLGRFCLGEHHLNIQFEFTQNVPAQQEKFDLFFNNPVAFNCPKNRAILAPDTLKKPCIFQNTELSEKHDHMCSQYLNHIQRDSDILKQVKLAIRSNPLDRLTLEVVAQQLHMSPRSLRRHLQQQASSFSALLENERKHMAAHKLTQSKQSLDNLSEQLGYHSAASFSRAFKRWFGVSPAQFRQNNQAPNIK